MTPKPKSVTTKGKPKPKSKSKASPGVAAPVQLQLQPPVDPVTLQLDTKNPRFAGYSGSRKEKAVIEHLIEHADLQELIQSIAANGYVDFEPLVVIDEDGDGTLTVIEGNRRVAALKLLRNPALAADLQVQLPSIRPDLEPSLRRARVAKVTTREDARQFIGFKHINGPHKWDAFAKAQFAADWYEAERGSGTTIREIAHRLGDRHDTILRLVNGIYVLRQAQRLRFFSIEDRAPGRPFFFSHLYVALTRKEYREYLGLDSEWRGNEPIPDPIKPDHYEQLKQVLLWIYGSAADDLEPLVTSQNPHVKELGEILAHPVALKRLVATRDLRKAYAEVATRGRKFEESLIRSFKYAEDAQSFSDAYDGDAALIEFGERLAKIGHRLVQLMRDFKGESS